MAVKYFDVKDVRYKVKKYKPDKKLKLGNAYIVGDYVIPYKGEFRRKSECLEEGIGIYDCEELGGIIIIKPFGKYYAKKYSKKNIYELDLDYIKKIIVEEGISSDLDDNVLELDSGNTFEPPISDNDNLCQKIIKDILQRKKIDLKQYSNRFESPTMMGNWKRSLLEHGMATERFLDWCEKLDVDIDIVYKDKKGCAHPMGGEFHSKEVFK